MKEWFLPSFHNVHQCTDKDRNIFLTVNDHIYKWPVQIHNTHIRFHLNPRQLFLPLSQRRLLSPLHPPL